VPPAGRFHDKRKKIDAEFGEMPQRASVDSKSMSGTCCTGREQTCGAADSYRSERDLKEKHFE
jgi:hypothetical protein